MIPTTARIPTDRAARRRRLGIEVHVVEGRDAAAQHLAAGEHRAVVDERVGYQGGLDRPDPLVQPALERQVVGDAAQQAHRGVAMQIDQAGDQQVVGALDQGGARMAGDRLGARQHCFDPLAPDHDRMVVQDRGLRRHRRDPAGGDQDGVGGGDGHGQGFCAGPYGGEAPRRRPPSGRPD